MWAYRTIAELNDSRTGTEAQESFQREWIPPAGTLGELVRATSARVHRGDEKFVGLIPSFAAALRQDFVALIAEIKRSSPSKGVIRADLDAGRQAAEFERGKASAISVLTEPLRFGGSPMDIGRVKTASALPILKKDFHSTPEHILAAKAMGASAALLIVRAVPPQRLRECIVVAHENAIDLLVEVHREEELDLALASGASIIGVNARNLETLEMDETVHERLIPKIPRNVIAIAESGMTWRVDVRRASELGADAVLIGSSLSESEDLPTLLKSLTTVVRKSDVRPD